MLTCLGVDSSLLRDPIHVLIMYFRVHTEQDGNPEAESEGREEVDL